MNIYPGAERQRCFFAVQYLRWLYESGAVNDIGPGSTSIVTAVVLQEDAIHYSRPPTFWNSQLMMRAGLQNEKTFIGARQRAVDAGLLDYTKGTKTQPATYFVDGWTVGTTGKADELAVNPTANRESIENQNGNILTSTPTPTATCKRARTHELSAVFQMPTFEEVTAYCRERGNKVDPQAWWDHYTANGWMVGANPMRDWQAAVRRWETNGVNKPESAGFHDPSQYKVRR